MKAKPFFVILAILAVCMFIFSCTKEVSETELQSDLEKLSDAELKEVINEAESEGALAGQAVSVLSQKYEGVSKTTLAKIAYKVAYERAVSTIAGSISSLPGGSEKSLNPQPEPPAGPIATQ